MSALFLDDSPARRRRFLQHCPRGYVADSAALAIAKLGIRDFHDLVFLDHDLGDEVDADPMGADTGSEVVRWIVANRPTIGRIVVHTMGNAGPAMRDALLAAGYDAECIGFMSLIQRFDEVLNANVRERTAP